MDIHTFTGYGSTLVKAIDNATDAAQKWAEKDEAPVQIVHISTDALVIPDNSADRRFSYTILIATR